MARYALAPEPQPIASINITPLIDVMLVLLIMMILTIPIATHQIPIDLPNGPATAPTEDPHRLSIDRAGALAWDGQAIADEALPGLLAQTRGDTGPVLHLQTDPEVRYDRFAHVLSVVKRNGVTKLGFIGNRPFDT